MKIQSFLGWTQLEVASSSETAAAIHQSTWGQIKKHFNLDLCI